MEWINVEDGLLKDEESGLEFICMTSAAGRCKGVMALDWEVTTVRGKTVKRWLRRGRICPWNVTHWMKEPEPPKAQS